MNFSFKRRRKRTSLCLEIVGQWSSSWWIVDGSSSKDMEERKSQARSSTSPSWGINKFSCLQKGLEYGITYKRDLTTQYVKPNKYCI